MLREVAVGWVVATERRREDGKEHHQERERQAEGEAATPLQAHGKPPARPGTEPSWAVARWRERRR